MDLGMENGRYYFVDEVIESGVVLVSLSFDKILDVLCVIDIMDYFFVCEV